jgi:uncharacterized integral membrane protein (TIGR00698 family)
VRFPLLRWTTEAAPGIALSAAVTAIAVVAQSVEAKLLGRPWLEALVLAIVIGTVVRSVGGVGRRFEPGIHASAKVLLEVAVVLLGASISAAAVAAAGPRLLVGIVGVVAVALAASYTLGRLLGLHHTLATLVARGNSICGNSAIVAAAPAIGAAGDDIGASIAFTAALGVGVVLALPTLVPLLHLSATQYGVLAGLTVYAVPQVIAATAPVGLLSIQVGTLVKLVRVLTLGPVVLALSVGHRRGQPRMRLGQIAPWFIVGFLALMGARSLGWIPVTLLAPLSTAANWLTLISMAALGLSVDLGAVLRSGPRVIAAAFGSLIILGAISQALIRTLGIA